VLQTPTSGDVLLDGTTAAGSVSTAVSADDVTRRYGSGEAAVDALRGVTIDIPRGQFAAIMGPSGSGKSTLMHVLAGLDVPTSGTVHIAGEDITKMNDAQLTKLRRAHIGFVFQAFNLLPTLSVEENVALPLALGGRKADAGRLDSLLREVGLADRRRHRPAELSGGQQQRAAMARALITRPTVLFADEPTGNLDSRTGEEILALLREAVRQHDQTTVIVTHDPRAAATADRVVFLADGEIAAELRPNSVDEVIAAYKEATVR
jgi:putative ABC transport system ATP-binding protein